MTQHFALQAKPTKHNATEIAAKAHAATVNKGGGKDGMKDRLGGAVGHSKFLCNHCKTPCMSLAIARVHHESKHSKIPFLESDYTDVHALVGGVTTVGVAVRGTTNAEKLKKKGPGARAVAGVALAKPVKAAGAAAAAGGAGAASGAGGASVGTSEDAADAEADADDAESAAACVSSVSSSRCNWAESFSDGSAKQAGSYCQQPRRVTCCSGMVKRPRSGMRPQRRKETKEDAKKKSIHWRNIPNRRFGLPH